jgi:hypothetical protein
MKKINTTLLHPFFIVSLIVLLLNDMLLKPLYHNWLTGKLSDFAGLAAFAIFFTGLLPNKKRLVFITTALLFIWWKSPLSQPFMFVCNNFFHLPVARVVDYTDYMALLVLPVAWQIKPVNPVGFYKRAAAKMLGVASIFAFCATSMPYRYLPMSETSFQVEKRWSTNLSAKEIEKRLDSMHIAYTKDSFEAYPESHYELYGRSYYHNSPPEYFYTQQDSASGTQQTVYLPANRGMRLYRRYRTAPFYLLHNVVVGDEIIPGIKIRLYSTAYTPPVIIISEMELTKQQYDSYMMHRHKTAKKYTRGVYDAVLQKLLK